eukprot:gnl/MRDRNA2_/MRDRNA2_80243_c0_seq1.p1 gnl/MRDRNA2_/MRDRNA2_80243_c0~~gnl/MRDRNA2_/MRDRNA2_80243_c0_seq1.p1  ORF type:complete len:276 (+),score=45.28 gnl/MRDRNA2_/MRDRNA2_80243_c0_seq1:531-1358(+)
MWYDDKPECLQYADVDFEINRKYCEMHGYTLIRSKADRLQGKLFDESKRAVWNRCPLVASYLHDFDFVMYVDADAFFYREAMPLHELIAKVDEELPGWDFVLARDLDGAACPPAAKTEEDEADCNINAGVFLVRSSPKAQCVLREWDKLKETLLDDQLGLRQIWLLDACGIRNSTYIFDWGDLQIFSPLHMFRHAGWHPEHPMMCYMIGYDKVMEIGYEELLKKSPLLFHSAGWPNAARESFGREYAPMWGIEVSGPMLELSGFEREEPAPWAAR